VRVGEGIEQRRQCRITKILAYRFRCGQATPDDFARVDDILAVAGGDIAAAATMLRRTERTPPRRSFLVPGLIPDGAPSLLLGSAKAGKSTALLELAVAVARREPEWMGFPIDHSRRGLVVFFAGEDSEAEVVERVKRMTGGEDTPYGLMIVPAGSGDLDQTLGNLERENVRMIIIDPARKILCGRRRWLRPGERPTVSSRRRATCLLTPKFRAIASSSSSLQSRGRECRLTRGSARSASRGISAAAATALQKTSVACS
jgi:AAA domain